MLILQRRVGERIVIGGDIEITVAEITKRGVRLALRAPRGVTVLRGETHDAVVASNEQAARAVEFDFDLDATDASNETPREDQP